jgi:hypothetical protein
MIIDAMVISLSHFPLFYSLDCLLPPKSPARHGSSSLILFRGVKSAACLVLRYSTDLCLSLNRNKEESSKKNPYPQAMARARV